MSRAICGALTCLGVGSVVAGCASAPVQTASGYAGEGAGAIYRTGSDVYAGVGDAAKRPLQDLNMMQDPIPMVLLRAELDPYSVKGLTSCDVLTARVAELDLALGPDLDAPADHPKSHVTEDAGLAAAAALEAAAAAADGFIPARSIIKHVSGASKYEAHVKHAILAGTERRTFLKAIGVMHNCSWPAAPLTVTTEDAKVVTIWGPASLAGQLNAVVQTSAPALAIVPTADGASAAQTARSAPAMGAMRSGPVVQTAALAPSRAAGPASLSGPSSPSTPQAVAQPVSLVSGPSGAVASTPTAPVAPYPGAAPWESPPPGGR
jgi:hypothetical protein